MYLDTIEPDFISLGHGIVGYRGSMGYGMPLGVNGHFFEHAISAHPPSRLQFALKGQYEHFTAYAALNDTSSETVKADFLVYADGILVAYAPDVRKGERFRRIAANIQGAAMLELVIETDDTTYNHALWLDPMLNEEPEKALISAANRLQLLLPQKPPLCKRCIAMIADTESAEMLDNFLGSLHLNGNVRDAGLFVLTNVGDNRAIRSVARKYRAHVLEYRSLHPSNIWLKNALYSLPHAVIADQYLYIDIDMAVLEPIDSIFQMLDACNPKSVFMARDVFSPPGMSLGQVLCEPIPPYFGNPETRSLLKISEREMQWPLIVNGGAIAGNRKGMLAIDNVMRAMSPEAGMWLDENPGSSWREQAILNLAVARLGNGIELDYRYNCQLLTVPAQIHRQGEHIHATHDGQLMHVVHFNGDKGRERYKEVKGAFKKAVDLGRQDISVGDAFLSVEQEIGRYARSVRRSGDTVSVHRFELVDKMGWPMRVLYNAFYQERPASVLDIDTLEGVFAYMLRKVGGAGCSVKRIEEDSKADLLDQMILVDDGSLKRVKGDPFVTCKEMRDRFDMILMDTKRNEKNTTMLAFLAQRLLNEGGVLLIHDINNPLCNFSLVKAKLALERLIVQEDDLSIPSFVQQRIYVVRRDAAVESDGKS